MYGARSNNSAKELARVRPHASQTRRRSAATDKLSRRAWGTLLVLCGALFLDALDVSMIGVALPSIRTDLAHVDRARCSGS